MGNLSPQQQLETDTFIKSIFIKNAIVTKEDVIVAKGSWKLIINNMAPGYLELKANPEFPSTSCLSFFFDSYYAEFFSGDERSSEIYNKNMHIQGRAMISMMNSVLNFFEDRKTINKKLIDLAQSHHKKGVSTSQYGSLVRGVLSALQKCLGSSFRGALCESWYKIFSYILEIVVHKSLELEKWDSYIQTAGIMVTYISNTFVHPVKDKIIIEESRIEATTSINRNNRDVNNNNYDNLDEIKHNEIDDEINNNNTTTTSTSRCKYLSPKRNTALYDDSSYNTTTNKSKSTTSRSRDTSHPHHGTITSNNTPSEDFHNSTSTSTSNTVTTCPFSHPQGLPLRRNNRNISSSDTPNNTRGSLANGDVTHENHNGGGGGGVTRNTHHSNNHNSKESTGSVVFLSSFTHYPMAKQTGTSMSDIELNHVAVAVEGGSNNPLSRILNTISHTTTRIVSK